MNKDRLSLLRTNAIESIIENNDLINTNKEVRDLVHELSVYHEELEAQKEELENSQVLSQSLTKKFTTLFEVAPVGYLILDSELTVLEYNRKAVELLRLNTAIMSHNRAVNSRKLPLLFKLVESQLKIISWLSQAERNPIDIRFRKDPDEWFNLAAVDLDDSDQALTLLAITDVSERIVARQELESRANYDQLTKLPNRQLLVSSLNQAMSRAKRTRSEISIIFIDLDGFKKVNDDYGHEIGDQLLVEISKRIRSVLRVEDILCRYGGDEFVLVVGDSSVKHDESPLLERILGIVSGLKYVKDKPINISASLGVTTYPQRKEVNPEQLIRQADIAMYRAKQLGKNHYQIYDVDKENYGHNAHRMRRLLLSAIEQSQFEMFYQPKISFTTKQVDGFEALLRWNHPTEGLLTPASFSKYLDTGELGIAIDRFVIQQVFEQLAEWNQSHAGISVSINLSAFFVQDKNFLSKVRRTLEDLPEVCSSQITFEITETATIENLRAASDILKDCQKLGVQFSLDDFGTGYSSLSYLKELPFNELKIDLSFIRDMFLDESDMELIKGIIYLSKALGLKSVAEGVETKEQWHALKDLGCDIAQGLAISKAMSAREVLDWIASDRQTTFLSRDPEELS